MYGYKYTVMSSKATKEDQNSQSPNENKTGNIIYRRINHQSQGGYQRCLKAFLFSRVLRVFQSSSCLNADLLCENFTQTIVQTVLYIQVDRPFHRDWTCVFKSTRSDHKLAIFPAYHSGPGNNLRKLNFTTVTARAQCPQSSAKWWQTQCRKIPQLIPHNSYSQSVMIYYAKIYYMQYISLSTHIPVGV